MPSLAKATTPIDSASCLSEALRCLLSLRLYQRHVAIRPFVGIGFPPSLWLCTFSFHVLPTGRHHAQEQDAKVTSGL